MAKEPDEVRRRIYLPTPGNVYDRWTAVSEQVYGIALRNRLLIERAEFLKAIQHVRPMIIYCRPSNEIMDANLARQETKPHKDEAFIESIIVQREQIRFLYDDLMSMLPTLGCLVVHYDYTKHGSALL